MPGKNISNTAELSPAEIILREELRADVQKLAGEIGERNMDRYAQLTAAADFIEKSFSSAGLESLHNNVALPRFVSGKANKSAAGKRSPLARQ